MKINTDNENGILYDSSDLPMVISHSVFSLFLKCDDPTTCGMVYLFYCHTAMYQKTNQVWATSSFVQKGLKIGKIKFNRAKKQLLKYGLIEDVLKRDKKNRKIKKHYIKINFIWKEKTVQQLLKIKNHTPENNPIDTKNHTPVFSPVDNQPTNALSVLILNALSNKRDFGKLTANNLEDLFILSIQKLPKRIQTENIIISMYEFFQYKKEIKKPIKTKIGVTKLMNNLKDFSEKEIIKAIDDSIANGWSGIFPKKQGYTKQSIRNGTRMPDEVKQRLKNRTITIE